MNKVFPIFWVCLLSTSLCRVVWGEAKTCSPGRGEVLVRSADNEQTAMATGSFESPNWSRQTDFEPRCVYRFIANVGEKVHIRFDRFQLNGEMPYCSEDFLDVYIDVASSSLDIDRENALLSHLASGEPHTTTPFSAAVYSTVLDRSALLGRYCDSSLAGSPVEFVSLHREIVLDFYTSSNLNDVDLRRDRSGFNGTFEFIRDSAYYPGRALSPTELITPGHFSTMPACRFRIDATANNGEERGDSEYELPGLSGELISPTYPGFHPDGLFCAYQLIGRPTQRINVDVLDLNLPEQSNTCTMDYLLFHDGETANAETPQIGQKFCGRNRRLRIVSSGSSLLILFVTGNLIGSRSDRMRLKESNDHMVGGNGEGRFKRRGFKLRYTFTDKLLAVHPNHRTLHIRGTECDYAIRSHGASEAKFESPTYKNNQVLLPRRVCSFYFVGATYEQHMETVRIAFDELDLPSASASNVGCDRGFLAIYGSRSLNGFYQLTEPTHNQTDQLGQIDTTPDQVLCGSEDQIRKLRIGASLDQAPIVGQHSLVLLRLNATGSSPPGLRASFRLIYRFDRAFGVPGAPITSELCQFLYSPSFTAPFSVLSSSNTRTDFNGQHDSSTAGEHRLGWTNSPFYPNPYPSNCTCLYLFVPNQHGPQWDRMRLAFTMFETQSTRQSGSDLNNQLMPFSVCDQDFLEVVEIHIPVTQALFDHLTSLASRVLSLLLGPTSWIRQWQNIDEELRARLNIEHPVVEPVAVYCGTRIPGPVLSHSFAKAMLLRFHSNRNSNAKGFTLKYEFINPATLSPSSGPSRLVCGGNFSFDHPKSGLIETPNYPEPYPDRLDCVWKLMGSAKDSQLQLHFTDFHLEGNTNDCSRAVIRIYEGNHFRASFEFCGNQSKLPPLVLSTSIAVVRLHTTENVAKAPGFRLVWTELLSVNPDGTCDGFRCEHTKHCISRSLECNGIANCGAFGRDGDLVADISDETSHCMKAIAYNFLHIGIGVMLTFALLLSLAGFIYYRERKRRLKMPTDPLAELTGSKPSLVSNHPSQTLHRHHCPNAQKLNHHHHHHQQHRHTHSRSHHNSRTHLPIDDDVLSKTTLTRTGSLGGGITVPRRHHHHSFEHRVPNPIPAGTHVGTHECTSRHQLIPVHAALPRNTLGPPSSRLRYKSSRPLPLSGTSLSRNGGTLTGSIHSGVVAGTGSGMSVEVDGGFLIREKMQKISIV